MFFTKKKIPQKQHRSFKTPKIFGIVGIIAIIFLGFISVKAVDNLEFDVFGIPGKVSTLSGSQASIGNVTGSGGIFGFIKGDNSTNPNAKDIEYILLTGRGGGTHDAPNLTDTIILAGIDFKKEQISMLSLPRDLWVTYPVTKGGGRINGIYDAFLHREKNEDYAMKQLVEKVGEITGVKIDHYVNFDFKGFIEIVDTLGGVEVTLEKNFVDYQYPAGPGRYKHFILRKGTWNLDGEVALMYARSRKSTSDFDRSLRQQQIIGSLQKKISELGYFKDRKQIKALYDSLSNNIHTDMGLSDIISLGFKMKGWKETKTQSFNLNTNCFRGSQMCSAGGFLYFPERSLFGGASVSLPRTATAYQPSKYEGINTFADIIFHHGDIFTYPAQIEIYNNSGIGGQAGLLADTLQPYGFTLDVLSGVHTLREKKFEKSILYYNGIDSDNETLQVLKKFLDIEMKEVPEAQISKNSDTRIEIILTDSKTIIQ